MKRQLHSLVLTVITLLALSSNAHSQTFNCLWAKSSQQSAANATATLLNDVYAMATDAGGNTYITGTFSTDTITFGSVTLKRAYPSKTNSDFFIVKYNSSGTVVWAKSAGGNGENARGSSAAGFDNIASGTGITIDNAGNIYVTGYFQSDSVVFGNYTLTTVFGTLSDYSNIFLVKYSPSGNVIWAKEAGTSNYNIISASITADAKANVYITGSYRLDSQVSSATINGITLAGNGYLIAKYDSSGNIKWAKTAVGGLTDYSSCNGGSIKCDANGNVFVAGTYFGDSTAFGNKVTLQNNLGGVSSLMFVVKYDSLGNALWAQNEDIGIKGGGFNGITIGGVNGVATDAEGDLYVTGGFYNATATFGSTTLTNTATGGFDNMFLVKYSPSGSVLWAKSATETPSDFDAEGLSVAADASGNVFVTGSFYDTFITFGSKALRGSSAQTIFIAQYDSLGNVLGAMAAGSGGYQIDEGVCVTTDNNGSIFVSGIYYDTLAFDSKQMMSGPEQGVYVAKFNDISSGINQVRVSNNQLVVYPNPATKLVTIAGNQPVNTIVVTNVLGEVVYKSFSGDLGLTRQTIDVSTLPNGLYFISMTTDTVIVTEKFVVQR